MVAVLPTELMQGLMEKVVEYSRVVECFLMSEFKLDKEVSEAIGQGTKYGRNILGLLY